MVSIGIYLDTNIVAALLIQEPLSSRAERFFDDLEEELLVSDLTATEFSSLVARRVRTGEFTMDQARIALANFDVWMSLSIRHIETSATDISVATAFLRRLDLPLRTLDAIHIAIAQRVGATLVTFDRRMAASARAIGATVATP